LTSVPIKRKFKKILVAIDGSQESINAADYAISIAKATTIKAAEKHSSELTLLHVMSSEVKFGHASGIYGMIPPEHAERMKQEAHKWFDIIRDRIDNTHSIITVSTEVISTGASPQVAIVEYAEKKNIDLVVMGTRGMSGFKKLLLGSVASGVIKYSHCPVLVVK
jgi:nucleotide-binding universal stress UspA family protein